MLPAKHTRRVGYSSMLRIVLEHVSMPMTMSSVGDLMESACTIDTAEQ